MTAAEAVAQLCARKMTAVQYAEAVLEVAETYSCLNAFSFLKKEKVVLHLISIDLYPILCSAGIYCKPPSSAARCRWFCGNLRACGMSAGPR